MTVPWREVVDKACIEEHAQRTSNEVVCARRMGSETFVKITDCICKRFEEAGWAMDIGLGRLKGKEEIPLFSCRLIVLVNKIP